MFKKLSLFAGVLALAAWGSCAKAQTLTTIQEARKVADLGKIKITGTVVNGAEFGVIRYFQDATGGYAVYGGTATYTPGSAVVTDLVIGDSIVVTGTIHAFNNLQQISSGTTLDPITVEIVGKGKKVSFIEGNASIINKEENEGRLLKITDVVFDKGGQLFARGNYKVRDAAANVAEIRIDRTDNQLIAKEIPSGTATLYGVNSQFNATYQMLMRGPLDMIVGLTISNFKQSNLKTTRFDVSWATSVASTTLLKYRKIGAANFDTLKVAGSSLTHFVSLTGLSPATQYELQGISQTPDGKIAASSLTVMSTVSESLGTIKVFFNKDVDKSKSNGPVAVVSANMADTIAKYIDKAVVSVDVAVYNTNDGGAAIVNAINNAAARGVRVRIITDGETANIGFGKLRSGIPVAKDNNADGLMHNKFVLIDAGSRLNSWVLTGSSNFTDNNLKTDANNFVFIQDQAVAGAYQTEFEEMWGGNGPQPKPELAKFGAAKANNTAHNFIVGGKPLELYFSPSDNVTGIIQQAIESTDNDVRFSVLTLTMDDLANALIKEKKKGWDIRGLVSDSLDTGNDYKLLATNGVKMGLYKPKTGFDLHHKYAVVDAGRADKDPLVLTGSHNWSAKAQTSNDENTLVIHRADIANLFVQEFAARYKDATGTADDYLLGNTEQLEAKAVTVFPNPANETLFVRFEAAKWAKAECSIFDMQGRLLQKAAASLDGLVEISLADIKAGVYIVKITDGDFVSAHRFVVNK